MQVNSHKIAVSHMHTGNFRGQIHSCNSIIQLIKDKSYDYFHNSTRNKTANELENHHIVNHLAEDMRCRDEIQLLEGPILLP